MAKVGGNTEKSPGFYSEFGKFLSKIRVLPLGGIQAHLAALNVQLFLWKSPFHKKRKK